MRCDCVFCWSCGAPREQGCMHCSGNNLLHIIAWSAAHHGSGLLACCCSLHCIIFRWRCRVYCSSFRLVLQSVRAVLRLRAEEPLPRNGPGALESKTGWPLSGQLFSCRACRGCLRLAWRRAWALGLPLCVFRLLFAARHGG